MSDEEKEREIEKLTLLPDRYYIILNKVDEESFTLTAYDTTGVYDTKNPCSAAVAQEEAERELARAARPWRTRAKLGCARESARRFSVKARAMRAPAAACMPCPA